MEKLSSENEHEQIALRRAKLAELRAQGNAFPTDFRRNVMAAELHAEYGDSDAAALKAAPVRVKVAGRMMTRRIMGKASFVHLQDMSGQIQLYFQGGALPQGRYEAFQSSRVCRSCGASSV